MSASCTTLVWQPGVAAQPSPAVTSAQEAGASGGSRARPKGRGSQGPPCLGLSYAREEAAGCVVWDGEGSGFRPAASYPAEVFTMGMFTNS